MQWLMVCCVLSLLSVIECAGVKGKHCPEQKPSAPPSPVPPANLSAPIILNINQLRDVKKSSTAGGYGGDKFSDPVESRELVQIYSITIWHGEKVEGIEVVYIDSEGWEYRANHHGSNEGDKIDTVALDSEHVIVRIEGFTDYNYVGSISFVVENTVTGERATHGPYGQDSSSYPYSLDGIILGFHGREGEKLDALGAYYLDLATKGPKFGGDGGDSWEDPVNAHVPGVVGIKRIAIKHGQSIDSIQMDYSLLWDGTYHGERHGGDGGSMNNIDLQDGEKVVEVRALVGLYLNQLVFVTQKQDGTTREYGPFGQVGESDKELSFFGDIIGFYGSVGNILDSLGVYYIDC